MNPGRGPTAAADTRYVESYQLLNAWCVSGAEPDEDPPLGLPRSRPVSHPSFTTEEIKSCKACTPHSRAPLGEVIEMDSV